MVRVSVVWLNYNSMKFRDVMLRSLDSFMNLDFDDYELIIVDNASSDGSFELIRKYVEERKPSNLRVKIIRNEENLGYAGGMNKGWEARDKESKYIAFANNDLIAEPQSLMKLVEVLESEDKVGAVSGLIYFGDGRTIYSTGGWVDELWLFDGICHKALPDECSGIDEEYYVTYADGAYMVVNAEAVKRSMYHGKPFIDETFLYLDDSLLGLVLWNRGYRVKYVPITAGLHYASMTTRGSLVSRYSIRGIVALSYIVKTKYSDTLISRMITLKRSLGNRLLCKFNNEYCLRYEGFIEGVKLAQLLMNKVGILDLYKAPYAKTNIKNTFVIAFMPIYRIQISRHLIHIVNDEIDP